MKELEMKQKEDEKKLDLEYKTTLMKNLSEVKLDKSALDLFKIMEGGNSNNKSKEVESQQQSQSQPSQNQQIPQQIQASNPQMMYPPQQMYNPKMMYLPQQMYNPQMMYPPQQMYNYQQQQLATPGNNNINNSQMNYNQNIPQQI